MAKKNDSKPAYDVPCSFDLKGIRSIVVSRWARMADGRSMSRVINDAATIKTAIALIRAFPRTGPMMIKMGPDAERIEAVFYGSGVDGPVSRLELYDGRVKAPNTGFFSEQAKEQEQLRTLLLSIKPQPLYTFEIPSAEHIRVEAYDHAASQVAGSAPDRAGEISDPAAIRAILAVLKRLPEKGNLFASFTAQVPLTEVSFVVKGEEQERRICFYGSSLRTLDGSFFGDDAAKKDAKTLYELLTRALTQPK